MSIDKDVASGVAIVVVVGVGIAAMVAYNKKKKVVKAKDEVITMADAIKEGKKDTITYYTDDSDVPYYENDADDEEGAAEDEDEGDIILSDEGGDNHLLKGTDINSDYALEQFINMELADFRKHSAEDQVLRRLFKYEFLPKTRGDRTTRDILLTKRVDFFGPESKWSWEATWADLILYFANRINYNLQDGLDYWVRYILSHLDFRPGMREEDMIVAFENLITHTYINNDTGFVGLFGLDDGGCNDVNIQLKRSIDTTYSFEMEYNAFLNMAME